MKSQQIALPAFVALVVICCVACAQQKSGTPPNTVSAADQIAQVKTDLDASRVLKLRGVLRDRNGKRLTGVVGVLFALYEQQEGGAPLWQEVQNVQVDRGNFTALVGSTKSGGIFPELFPPEKTRWLGRQVLLPGEVEQPRIRLVSTPEGLMAEGDVRLLIPAKSGDQPATVGTSETIGPQQDQSQPTNTPSRARRRLLHSPMP